MNKRKLLRVVIAALILAGVGLGVFALYNRARSVATREKLFDGVTYTRMVRRSPRPMVIHAITIDMRGNGVRAAGYAG